MTNTCSQPNHQNSQCCDCPDGQVKDAFGKCVMPTVTFSSLLLSLNTSALFHMGELAHPESGKTVMELVADVPATLRPVGRLDKDSEGLLLMTDDGAFINMLTHPSGGVGKLYRVTVNPRATERQIIEMSSGVVLDDGVKTRPCVIHVVVDEPGRSVLEITLHEGRNRQIRRMCSAVGLQVVRLRRSAEGPVKLGMLQPGEYRELKKSEINALRNAAMKSAGKGESRAASPARRPGPLKKRTNSD